MSNNNLVFFKLGSSEEIVSELVEETPTQIIVKKSIMIQFVPNQTGQVTLQFIPYPLGVDPEQQITILKSALAFLPIPAPINFQNAYNQKYGSGIEVITTPHVLHS